MPILKYVDLFCGTGAFSLAMNKIPQTECVFANDMCPNSHIIYKTNFPSHNFVKSKLEDIKVEDIPTHDILFAGFPCQSWSTAGLRKGFADDRGQAFFYLLNVIKYHQPEVFVLENVKYLTKHDEGRSFNTILTSLEAQGYTIRYKVLDTALYTNIPQRRERIYIVGFKTATNANNFNFPSLVSHTKAISDMLEINPDAKYTYDGRYKIYDKLKREMTLLNTLYRYKGYIQANKSNVCPTLTASMGGGGHNVMLISQKEGEIRKLTPRECFNFQGFPKSYILPAEIKDRGLYRLAGNAVSYPVVEKLLKCVFRALLQSSCTPSQSVS